MAEFKYSIARNIVIAAVVFSIILGVALYAPVGLAPNGGVNSSNVNTSSCTTTLHTINNDGKPMPGLNNMSQRTVQAFGIPIPCSSAVVVSFHAPVNNSFYLYNFTEQVWIPRPTANPEGVVFCSSSSNLTEAKTTIEGQNISNGNSYTYLSYCPGISVSTLPSTGHFASKNDNITVSYALDISSEAVPGLYFLYVSAGGCGTTIPIVIGQGNGSVFPAMVSSLCSGETEFPTSSVSSLVGFNVSSVPVEPVSNATSSGESFSSTVTSTVTDTVNTTIH